eukprot:5475152-Amphidinium_carterae.1
MLLPLESLSRESAPYNMVLALKPCKTQQESPFPFCCAVSEYSQLLLFGGFKTWGGVLLCCRPAVLRGATAGSMAVNGSAVNLGLSISEFVESIYAGRHVRKPAALEPAVITGIIIRTRLAAFNSVPRNGCRCSSITHASLKILEGIWLPKIKTPRIRQKNGTPKT